MPATIHTILGPPRAERTERLLAAYREAAGGLGSALLLVPTRRHADRVLDMLGNCLAPLILDVQAFADELVRVHEPAYSPHSDAERRVLIDAVLHDLRARDLPYFARVVETRGFAEAAAGYVAELKEADVELRQLLKTYPDDDARGGLRHYQATRILDRYQRRLAKGRQYDPPDRLGRAAKLWEDNRRQPFHCVESVFLAGFRDFTLYQKRLLDAVRKTLEHFWIELPEGEGDAFAGPRAVREWLGEAKFETIEAAAPPSLHLIEAPGELGEARLIARRVRTLLAKDIRPERVLVVARRFTPATIELFREVFDEYGIPHDAEVADTLARAPAVAFLLRARRLAEDGWEFAQVAAILRSTFFKPNWPEVRGDPEVAAKSEALMRMLGETRGREAYLKAVATWAETPPEPLEDEGPEEPVRKQKQLLAIRCQPFLERFLKAWEQPKTSGSAEATVARLKTFADDIGLTGTLEEDAADLARFWGELDRWARNESSVATRELVRPERFARVVTSIASTECRGRSKQPGGVILLSAERAAGLDCDYLFLVGLGEGSWPDLSAPVSLLDDAERVRLCEAGVELADPATRLGSEQLLFDTLIAAPKLELVLSYAAVDDKGQKLLMSSFLRELLAKSTLNGTTQQRMLLDGYFDQEPLSAAELRVQYARLVGRAAPARSTNLLSRDLVDNLSRAQTVAQARFQSRTFSPFDGELRHPAVVAELATRLGSEKVFSPTALENYIACPFRFFLRNVLGLETLEDPSEEVELTQRGSAFHRALARFHKKVDALVRGASAELPEGVTEELVEQLERAVGEYAARAPSRATAELWKLEGERLKRAARRYRGHWQEFRVPWREQEATPTPHQFEAAFGVASDNAAEALVIAVGGVEVRIGGFIDRIDLVELEESIGFWVIDYKTGRAANYQPSQVARFEKLQLSLYALAVERVLFKGQKARPLGLAYWLVTDTGPKAMLPTGRAKDAAQAWLADAETWPKFREQLESWVATLAGHIRAGDFPLAPRSEHCTDTCEFGPICRIAQSRNIGKPIRELPVLNRGPVTP